MRGVKLCVSVIGVMLIAALPASAGEDLMKEVSLIGDKMAKAMLDDNVEAMLAFYLDDAISLPNYSPMMQGMEAFRQHHDEMAKSGMKITSFDSSPTKVWNAGNSVIEIGEYKITLTVPEAPGPITDHGKYMTIYERQDDGSLKIRAETWNTDINPMEMAAEHAHHEHHEHEAHHEKPGE